MSLRTHSTAAAPCLSLGDAEPYKALPAFPVFSSIVSLHFITRGFCLLCREAGVGGTGIGAHSALHPTLGWLLCCPAVFLLKQCRLTVAIDYGKIVCG